MTRRWLVACALLPLALSCNQKPEPASVAPTESVAAVDGASDPNGGYPTPPPDAGDVTASPEAPAATGDSPDAATAPPHTDGGATEPVQPPAAAQDPPATEAGGTPVAGFALPKPIHSSVKASCGKDPGVGQKLKSFKLPRTEAGKTYSNGSFRGRVMVVNFWGTWCKPCLKELPKFSQLYRRYRKHGMTLLAIATDDDADAVKETLAAKKISAKVAIAGEEYAGKYESPDFPFTFVVDHEGVIQASYFGYEPECMGRLEADIRAQLEKRAAAKK